ncbi:uncharacterized protein [Chelonus insularis]|uniref:uncharacterized protein n=1 Tax=Chelonus insularis TaxID=460826 RepID=UPI00158B35F6|nr:uncharacterized protein LOC118063601 [Chelonus insularis]
MVNSKDIDDINAAIIALLRVQKNQTIPIIKIDRRYYEETGARIPYKKLGFLNLVDYFKTVPGVEVITVDNVNYVNVMGIKNSQHNCDHQTNQEKSVTPINSYGSIKKTYKNVPQCILSILEKSSRGLSKTKLIRELRLNYCLNESTKSLNYHLKTLRKMITMKNGLIYAKAEDDIESPPSVPVGSQKQLCLDDVVTTTTTDYQSVGEILVTDLKMNNNGKIGINLIEVEVVESYSPSFFWIHLLKNKKQFHIMMTTLGEFYALHYPDQKVPIAKLKRGLNIACLFDGKWHRAVIKSIDPNDKVTVMFYDFGTLYKCLSNEVYYLHQSFMDLPAQAVPCRLYGVAPQDGDKWPKRVRDFFNQWVYERPLWANIIEADVKKKSISVTLVDTSENDDFIINDWLIHNKMAKVKRVGCVDPEDLNLYVYEFSEYYIDEDGEYETVIPTTRYPESNSGPILSMSSSPKSVGSLNNKLELHDYDWKAFKAQVRKKIDEFIVLTLKMFDEFMKKNMESNADGIIQNFIGESLTDSIMEILFSFLDLDLQAQFSNASVVSSNESIADIDDERSHTVNKSAEESSSFDNISNLISKVRNKVTIRSHPDTLVQKAVSKFFKSRIINKSENSSSFAESIMNINPFEPDFFINDKLKKSETEPPPLPPRPFNNSSNHWNPFL